MKTQLIHWVQTELTCLFGALFFQDINHLAASFFYVAGGTFSLIQAWKIVTKKKEDK